MDNPGGVAEVTIEVDKVHGDDFIATAKAKFEEFDTNHNGTLSAKELKGVCEWIFKHFGQTFKTKTEHDEAVKQQLSHLMSKSPEGAEWTWELFSDYFIALLHDAEKYALQRNEAYEKGYEKSAAAEKFRELDVDNSGTLEGKELEVFAEWLHMSFRPGGKEFTDDERKAEGKKLLLRIDSKRGDGDGKLQFAEFDLHFKEKIIEIAAFKEKQAKVDSAKLIDDCFVAARMDSHGVISAADLAEVLKALTPEFNDENTNALLGSGDIVFKAFCQNIAGVNQRDFHKAPKGPKGPKNAKKKKNNGDGDAKTEDEKAA